MSDSNRFQSQPVIMGCSMTGMSCERRNLAGPDGVIRLTALAKAAG